MPIVSGGGGGGAPTGAAGGDLGGTYPNPTVDLMAGGTITGPLEIDTASQNKLILADDVGTQQLLVQENASGTAIYNDPNNAGAPAIRLYSTGLTLYSETLRSLVALVGSDLNLGRGVGLVVKYDSSQGNSYAVITPNTAPADATLVAGQCALWFDQTNGAAALKIKAKQADGTVKTATIPVIT